MQPRYESNPDYFRKTRFQQARMSTNKAFFLFRCHAISGNGRQSAVLFQTGLQESLFRRFHETDARLPQGSLKRTNRRRTANRRLSPETLHCTPDNKGAFWNPLVSLDKKQQLFKRFNGPGQFFNVSGSDRVCNLLVKIDGFFLVIIMHPIQKTT